jgi:hypothetical protein
MQIWGIKPCPNSPCILYVHPIPGKPPLYLAVYVDDFIYFSPGETVERQFETKMLLNGSLVHTMIGLRNKYMHHYSCSNRIAKVS